MPKEKKPPKKKVEPPKPKKRVSPPAERGKDDFIHPSAWTS
jgi:hypothetical protein